MDDKEEEGLIAVVGCSVALIAMPFEIICSGYVLSCLWQWFMVPLGVVPIGFFHALGLATLIGLYTAKYDHVGKKTNGQNAGWTLIEVTLTRFAHIFGALLIGWLWHHFMQS